MAHQKTASKTSGQRRTSTKSMKKAAAPRQHKRGQVEKADAESVESEEVSIDRRRGSRRDEVPGTLAATVDAALLPERRKKVNRRRQIDPTTCERDYTDQEVEFMNALDEYKRKSGRMFPTCSEVLEVLRGLGYVKLSAAELGALPEDNSSAASAKPMPSDWSSSAMTDPLCDGEEEPSLSEAELVC